MSETRKSTNAGGELPRRTFLQRSAAVAAPLLAGVGRETSVQASPSDDKKKRPNLILYISDQFRWDAMGAYGLNSMGLTPNLDAMARRGTLFRSHVTNQPVCAPSRTCLFTGQYQNRHGVWMNGSAIDPNAVTLATVLVPAPTGIPLADAAAIPVAALTAWQALFEHGDLTPGQRVLVNGAGGGVGGFTVQLAKRAGATVVATASPRSAAIVRSLGADQIIDYTAVKVADVMREPADLVVNLVAGSRGGH